MHWDTGDGCLFDYFACTTFLFSFFGVGEGGNLSLDSVHYTLLLYEPFVVCKFVAVVVPGHDVHQEYVLGFWVESCNLHFVTGEHPPTKSTFKKNINIPFQTQTYLDSKKKTASLL